jgi:hypothetical protein
MFAHHICVIIAIFFFTNFNFVFPEMPKGSVSTFLHQALQLFRRVTDEGIAITNDCLLVINLTSREVGTLYIYMDIIVYVIVIAKIVKQRV